jgi:hypothetical protein
MQEFAERVANKSTRLQVPLLHFNFVSIKKMIQLFIITNFLIHITQEGEVKILPQTYVIKKMYLRAHWHSRKGLYSGELHFTSLLGYLRF